MLRTTDELSADELSADFAAIAARGDRLRLKFYAGLRSDALPEIDASGLAFVTRTIGVFKYAVVADRLIQCLWTMRLENFVEAAQDYLGLPALHIVMAAPHLVLGPLKSCGDRKARPRSPQPLRTDQAVNSVVSTEFQAARTGSDTASPSPKLARHRLDLDHVTSRIHHRRVTSLSRAGELQRYSMAEGPVFLTSPLLDWRLTQSARQRRRRACHRSASSGAASVGHEEGSVAGLAFRNEVDLDGDALSAPLADSCKEFAYGLYSTALSDHRPGARRSGLPATSQTIRTWYKDVTSRPTARA
jgi:hypothetical protein